ncbi:MAG: tetratricopeptide repeat protein [Planctomycetaceae bacterium]|nr:tetratricopeptide repeat protein [Planctomycetaceae bacterium]
MVAAFAGSGTLAQVVPPNAPPASATNAGPQAPAAEVADYPDDARLKVALRMLGSGSTDLARMTAATVLSEKPDCDRAAAIQGIALNKLKRYEEARPLLVRARRSKQAFPEQRHAAHFLGWCCYHLGELELAREAFEAHVASVPNEPDSTFGLGLIALDEDRLDDADRLFGLALQGFTTPKDRPTDRARVLVRMSDLALRRDDVAGAEALLRRSVEASAVQHETWSKLARVYDRLGRTGEADAARANADRILTALGRKTGDAPPRDASAPGAPAAPASESAPAAPPSAPKNPAEP